MPVATMANPPEHDFAPSWLKIPSDNQLVAKPHSDQRAGSKYPSHSGPDGGRRSRHASSESSYQGYQPRHPQQSSILGYSSRDDKRFRPGPRYHSLEDPLRHNKDLPSAYAPLNHPPNGFLPPYFSSMDYQYPHPGPNHHHGKRGGGGGSPIHHNLNSYAYHGRSNIYGSDQGRGRYGSGGGGRRGGHSDKGGSENGESSTLENGGGGGSRHQKGDGGGGGSNAKGDEGKSKSDDSALSSHDFPSLSGDSKEEVKSESSKPVGAWEKRPETARINIGGRKLQLVQKTTAGDTPTTNGTTQSVAGKLASPSGGVNGVASLSSGVKVSTGQQSVQNKVVGRSAVPLSSSSSSSSPGMYKSLVSKASTPKATTPRKPLTKEVVIRPAPVISNKEKSAPPPPSSSSSSLVSSSSTTSSTTTFSSSSSSSSSSTTSTVSNGGGAPQPSSPAPTKEQSSPRATPAMDIPSPRMVTGKVKRTDKVDFLKGLRRSGSVDSPRPLRDSPSPREPPRDPLIVNGTNNLDRENEDDKKQPSPFRASTKQHYVKTNSPVIYQQPDPFDDVDIDEPSIIDSNRHVPSKCNGHVNEDDIDDNDKEDEIEDNRKDRITDNGHLEILQDENGFDSQPMELSSSLEAEKRLLHQMGWQEHSEDEEDFTPITEDELKEFKLRSQQLKKNGVCKPIILNLAPHPVINAITAMVIEDAEVSSASDTSDDEL